jgi:hypothetical protein
MPTTNYGWDQPTVGGDEDTWGEELNDTLAAIDTEMKTVSNAAQAAQETADDAATAAELPMVKLDSGVITTATPQLDVALPTGYRAFKMVIIEGYPASDADAWVRLNFGSGFLSGGSDYYWFMYGTGGVNVGDAADSEIELTYNTAESSGNTGSRYELDIVVPASPDSAFTIVDYSSSYKNFGGAAERLTGRGEVLTQTTRPTAVRFMFGGGVNISKLRWVLYGLNGL